MTIFAAIDPINAAARPRISDDYHVSSPEEIAALGLASGLLFLRCMKDVETRKDHLRIDPDEWKTGDEPMTNAQRSYLETLAKDSGEEVDDSLTKAEASKRIEELRERSPRLAGE